MSINDNCFLLTLKTLKGNLEIDSKQKELIKQYIENIFRNKSLFKDNAFDKSEALPFDIYFGIKWRKRKSVCLSLTSRSKVNLEKFNSIISTLSNMEDLKIDDNIVLNRPVKMNYCDLDRIKKKKGDKIWDTLEHNGPYFKHIYEPYERHNEPLIYDGQKYKLNDIEEEMATFYARRIITEKTSVKKFLDKKQFNENFFSDFKKYLSKENKSIFKNFNKLDFSLIVNKLEKMKEEKDNKKKDKTKQEKDKERIEKLEKKLDYSFAYVNGIKKEIRNPSVEIPGLYIGQGNILTNKGRIKGFINPEDVIINVSKGNEPLPPKGHKWGGIVTDNKASWIAKYKDTITGKDKYILLADSGELFKFEKARKLNKFIDVIDSNIKKLLKSDSSTDRQLGVIVYLVKNFGIRIGTEKDENDDENEEKVVGATTLMVNNILLNEEDDTKIDLRFFGKDSVLYDNTIEVSNDIYSNIKDFIKGKGPTSLVFDRVSASDVNNYLKGIDRDFSAKVFRTRLASDMMFRGLNDYNLGDVNDEEKLSFFTKVNKSVALKLNHKKGITDAQKNSLKKEQDEVDELKKKMRKEKDKKIKDKLKDKLKQKELKLENKKEKLGLALDTSKKNYIDPRIIKAWCENVDLPITKIYNTKTFQKYFAWVIEDDSINSDWNYMDADLDCIVGSELSPKIEKEDMIMPSRQPSHKDKKDKNLDGKITRECLDEKTKEDLFKIINLLGLPLYSKEYTKKSIIDYILLHTKNTKNTKICNKRKSVRKTRKSPKKSTRKSIRKTRKSPKKSTRKSVRKTRKSPKKSTRKSVRKTRKSTKKSTRKSVRKTRKSPKKSTRKSVRKTRKSPKKSTRKSVRKIKILYDDYDDYDEEMPLNKLKK